MKSTEPKFPSTAARAKEANGNAFFSKGKGETLASETEQVQAFFAEPKHETPFFDAVQPKLKVHPSNDSYEKEADATAERVVQGLRQTPAVQRQTDEEVQTKPLAESITPVQTKRAFDSPSPLELGSTESDTPLQTKAEGETEAATSALESQLQSSKGQGSPLPEQTRTGMESGFGADFSGVRAHTGSDAADMNKQLGARAFTHGGDIYFNQGEFQPGTEAGDQLLAHELTHTVQQGASSKQNPVQGKIQKAPAVAGAPTAATTVSSEIVDISKGSFEPSEKVKGEIEAAKNGLDVRIKSGNVTEVGTVKIKKDRSDHYDSVSAGYMLISNPWLQKIPGGVYLRIVIKDGQITEGYATVGNKDNKKDAWLKKIKEGADTIIGLGLKIGQLPEPVNEFSAGTLKLGANNLKLTIGGFLDAGMNLVLENAAEPKIEATGKVDVKGIAQGDLKLDNTKGPMTGEVGIAVNFPKFSGEVRVTYKADGSIDIRGKAGYTGDKLSGSVELVATDEETAKDFATEAIAAAGGKENAQEATPPPAVPVPPEGSKKRALAAVGQLTFNLTDWFAGTVNVIVDGKGAITVVGKIAPPKEIILFQQKDWEKELFKLEAKAYYGIPVVGNLNLFANIGLSAIAKLGPAKIYNIEVLGTYSTDPAIQKSIQIAASLNISAYAGLRLRAEGGAGIEILGHDLKFGVGLNADAGVKGYADARPTIGFRDPGEFFISGTMEIAAQPVIGLSGELFIKVDSPWWSPLPDKKWTWPLFAKEWPIGGTMGFKASVADYVLGSGKVPEVTMEPVEFDGAKFMSSMVDNNLPDKSGAGKEGGSGKFSEDGSVPSPVVKDPKGKPKDPAGKDAAAKGTPGKGGKDKKADDSGKKDDLKNMEAAMKKLKELEGHKPMTREEISAAVENIKKQFNAAVSFKAQGSDIWLVSVDAKGKGSKQPVKVKAIMKPGDEKEKKGSEKDKDKKLAAGIEALKAEDKKVAGDGKMNKEESDKVAKNVEKAQGEAFKSVKAVDAGENWKYHFVQKQAKEGDVIGSAEEKDKFPSGFTTGDDVIVMYKGAWQAGKLIEVKDGILWITIVSGKNKNTKYGLPVNKITANDLEKLDGRAKGDGKYYPELLSEELPDIGPKKHYTAVQKARIIESNTAKNGGVLKSDAPPHKDLLPATARVKGKKVNTDEVNIDHVFPRSKGGWNSYANAAVLSMKENISKSANT